MEEMSPEEAAKELKRQQAYAKRRMAILALRAGARARSQELRQSSSQASGAGLGLAALGLMSDESDLTAAGLYVDARERISSARRPLPKSRDVIPANGQMLRMLAAQGSAELPRQPIRASIPGTRLAKVTGRFIEKVVCVSEADGELVGKIMLKNKGESFEFEVRFNDKAGYWDVVA